MSISTRPTITFLSAALAAIVSTTGCVEAPDELELESEESELTFVPLCSTSVAFNDLQYEVPTISGVPHAEAHVRDNKRLVYSAGNYLDVVFTLPGCTWFSGVSRDGIYLGTSGGVEQSDYYQVVSDTAVGTDHRVRVRLWMGNAGTGAAHAMKIWANNSFRDGARSWDFTMSGVHDISRESKVSMSSAELKNNTATSFYKQFGDDGWQRDANGNKTRVHDPDYSLLDVRVESDHIWFRSAVKWRVYSWPANCDITAQASGRFKLARVNEGTAASPDWKLRVQWLDPDLSDPIPFELVLSSGICTAYVPDVVDGLVTLLANTFVDSIKTSLDDDLLGGIQCGGGGIEIDCALAVQRFEYATGELRAVLDGNFFDGAADGASITVRAPYAVLPAPGGTLGVPVPPGSKVLVTQEGLVDACHSDVGNPTTCNGGVRRKFGQTGLFNWAQPATWPVPDPYEYGSPPLPQREKALAAHVGLNRTASGLPRTSGDAGMLMGRVDMGASTSVRTFARPCIVETTAGTTTSRISLGRNDKASGGVPYGSGQPLVTLRFVGLPNSCGF